MRSQDAFVQTLEQLMMLMMSRVWQIKGEWELTIQYYKTTLNLDRTLQSALQQLENLK